MSNNFEQRQIDDMDEFLLLMNIPNTETIAKIGSKEVKIIAHGNARIHVTAILWI